LADVLILGAGVIGCAIADELTRRGASVVVLDPRGVGRGASRASAGMLAPFTEGRHDPALEALGAASLAAFDDLIDRVSIDGPAPMYSRAGSIDLAFDDETAAALARESARLRAAGVEHDWLDAAATRRLEPSIAPDVTAALLIRPHGVVAVPELTEALWRSASTRGATMVQASARRIARRGGTLAVETDGSTLEAPYVVLAAGSWAGRIELDGVAPLPVRPVRGQLLVLKWPAPPLPHVLWGPRCYLVPRADRTVLVGATSEEVEFDERATVAGVRDLLDAATELTARAWSAAFHEVRVGLRPAAPDGRPILGPSSRIDGLIYATAHFRNGALLTPLTALRVADMIEGAPLDPLLASCAPGRFGEY
jgi:glycine oxidase